VLYAGSIAWVIGYDTIYAHQDAEDDALIGIKSTALLFGERTRPALMVFYGLAVALIGVALALAGAGWMAWLGLAAFAVHLVWQIERLEIGDPSCACAFSSPTEMPGCCCLPGCYPMQCLARRVKRRIICSGPQPSGSNFFDFPEKKPE